MINNNPKTSLTTFYNSAISSSAAPHLQFAAKFAHFATKHLRSVLLSDFRNRQRSVLLPAIPRAPVARVTTRSAIGPGSIAIAEDAIASAFSLQHVKRDYRPCARSRPRRRRANAGRVE